MRFVKSLISLALFATLSAHAATEPHPANLTPAGTEVAYLQKQKWYEVEVIMFEYLNPPTAHQEKWQESTLQLPKNKHTISLRGRNEQNADQAYVLLPSSKRALNAVKARLRQHDDYRIMLHTAWRQPAMPKRQAKPTRLYGGTDYREQFLNEDSWSNTAQGNFLFLGNQLDQKLWEVDSLIKLSLDHFLRIDANLLFRKPLHLGSGTPGPENDDTPYYNLSADKRPKHLYTFHIKETRKLKSNQLFYFDHPMFGLILKVKPVTTPMAFYAPLPAPTEIATSDGEFQDILKMNGIDVESLTTHPKDIAS